MLGVCSLGWQDTIQSLENKCSSKVLERKLSKEITKHKTRILSRGIDDLSVTPNPRWGGFNVQPLLYQGTAWSWAVRTKEPLHTSIPLELLFTAPVRWAQVTTRNPEPHTTFLLASTDSSTTKPSRKRQLPRVTNQPLAWWFPSATKIETLMQCTRSSQSNKECNH
jgi:hypothetical protein